MFECFVYSSYFMIVSSFGTIFLPVLLNSGIRNAKPLQLWGFLKIFRGSKYENFFFLFNVHIYYINLFKKMDNM